MNILKRVKRNQRGEILNQHTKIIVRNWKGLLLHSFSDNEHKTMHVGQLISLFTDDYWL